MKKITVDLKGSDLGTCTGMQAPAGVHGRQAGVVAVQAGQAPCRGRCQRRGDEARQAVACAHPRRGQHLGARLPLPQPQALRRVQAPCVLPTIRFVVRVSVRNREEGKGTGSRLRGAVERDRRSQERSVSKLDTLGEKIKRRDIGTDLREYE